MEIEVVRAPDGRKKSAWERLMQSAGLQTELSAEETVLLWEGRTLAAAGSRDGAVLKHIAVSPDFQGEDLTAKVLTFLRQNAFSAGYRHLFLYTNPKNERIFRSLFFYPVAKTEDAVLMEDKKDGISSFLASLPKGAPSCEAGSCVMNCDPFTKGHRFLIEQAAASCERLYVFVLSEDQGFFSAEERLQMVRLGTEDLKNVSVLPTGPYLISSATFPSYFLKDRDKAPLVQCALDIAVFLKHFVPYFSITRRFVGTEPLSPLTNAYNETLKKHLPLSGVELFEIPRLEIASSPVSASRVRSLWKDGKRDLLSDLVPKSTYDFLTRRYPL